MWHFITEDLVSPGDLPSGWKVFTGSLWAFWLTCFVASDINIMYLTLIAIARVKCCFRLGVLWSRNVVKPVCAESHLYRRFSWNFTAACLFLKDKITKSPFKCGVLLSTGLSEVFVPLAHTFPHPHLSPSKQPVQLCAMSHSWRPLAQFCLVSGQTGQSGFTVALGGN